MTREQIKPIVIRVITKKFDLDQNEVKENSHLANDLGLDSMDLLELLMEFEKIFDIGIPDEEYDKEDLTVRMVIDLLVNLLKDK